MEYRLEELFDLQMGKTPARNNPRYWETTDNKWISIADLSKCGKYIKETKEYLSDVAIAESGISQIPANTVIMSFKLSIGKTAITYEPMYSNEAIMSFRDKHFVDLLPEYIYYLLVAHNWDEGTNKAVMGKTLNKATLSKVKVHIHPLEKQEEIVSILNKLTDAIQEHQQQLQKLDELIKSRFVEMFGHQSHNEKSLPYMTIDDVAEIYLGITHTPTYVDSGVMFISAKNTSGDFLDLSDVKYISREEFEGAPKGSKPQVNDVLFSRVGSNLGHPVILEEELELCTFVSLGFLRSKENVTSNYLKHWMRDEFFAKQVSEHVKGGGQPNLNTGWLKEFKIIVPDLEEQKAFDDFCKQVDKSKVAVQKSLDETQLLFDSLMQKYFG